MPMRRRTSTSCATESATRGGAGWRPATSSTPAGRQSSSRPCTMATADQAGPAAAGGDANADLRRRAEHLRGEIERANEAYYLRAEPILSDDEWDALFDELKTIESAHPELATPDSPTQRVGPRDPVASEFK